MGDKLTQTPPRSKSLHTNVSQIVKPMRETRTHKTLGFFDCGIIASMESKTKSTGKSSYDMRHSEKHKMGQDWLRSLAGIDSSS